MDLREDLREIIDGAFVSSYSLSALEIFRYLIATIIVSLIGSAGYGIIATLERTVASIRTIFSGLFVGLYRTVPRREDDEKSFLVVISFLVLISLVIIVSAFIFIFNDFLLDQIFETDSTEMFLIYGTVGFFITNVLLAYSNEVLKAYKKIPHSNAILRWISPILQILCIFGISLVLTMTVIDIILSMSLAFISAFLFGVYTIISYTSFNPFNLQYGKKLIKEYFKYVLAATGGSIFAGIQFSTPNLLMIIIPAEQAGAFGVGLIVAAVTRIPLNSINQIFPQIATRLYKEDEMDELSSLFKATSRIATFFTVIPAYLLVAYHREIMVLVSSSYEPYTIIIPFMIIGQVIAVTIGTVGLLIMMTDNQNENIPLQFVLMVITVCVSYYLTVNYGVIGLGIAYALAFSLNNIIELLFLYYQEGLFSITKGHLFMIVSLIVFSLIHLFIIKSTVSSIFIDVIIGILLCILFTYINYNIGLDSIEKEVIKDKKSDIKSNSKVFIGKNGNN